MSLNNLNEYIDHTYLDAHCGPADCDRLVEQAKQYRFKSVCVYGTWVAHCANRLLNTGVGVTAVISFPHGQDGTPAKADAIVRALADGASEIDVVCNYGKAIAGQWDAVENEIAACRTAAAGKTLKVIFETSELDDAQIARLCDICVRHKVDFVKTSTGFSKKGADERIVALMKQAVGAKAKVKASGGIRTKEDALKMIAAGAERIGTSQGVAICSGERKPFSGGAY